jgi:hypothetical protein
MGEREKSPRNRGLTTLDYPFHDWTATVTHCGRICFKKRKVNLSQVFADFAGLQVDVAVGFRSQARTSEC